MTRPCSTCQHLKRPEIDRRLAAGEPVAQVARDYDLNPSSLHRHKTNCLKLGSSNEIKKEAARGSAAVALLPSRENLGGAYADLQRRIDEIVTQAQQQGSLNVAISGLNSVRQTLDSLARLAGHLQPAGTQVNVAVQTNVNVGAMQIAERLIQKFDHEPELKARIAQALLEVDHEHSREAAYRVNPALWMHEVLGITPHDWQRTFLLAPRGASIAVLTARQVGKTTAAAVGIAHSAVFMPGSLSVIACPSQNQSAEALRKVRDMVLMAGAKLTTDNVFRLELANGSRVLALPGTQESSRGLTVDAWIVADEAAQLDPAIMAALHPMRTQRPHARFAMLSTAWSRTDPFWSVWDNDDPSWMRIRATIDVEPTLIAPDVLDRERRQLSGDDFNREYLGIPAGSQVSPFTYDLYERATQAPVHTWDCFKFHIIAHDVGHKKDRSTAVIGGPNIRAPGLTGMKGFEELPQGLSGNSRADALAMIDSRYPASLIIADLSYDPSYADILVERFGERVVGLQITSTGDTIDNWEERQLKRGRILVYKVSRTYLLDLLLREMQNEMVRILHGANSVRAYEQLMQLEIEFKQTRMVYKCPMGHHDDLAMSCAMVVWVAQHPHLTRWCWPLERRRTNKRPAPSALGWT